MSIRKMLTIVFSVFFVLLIATGICFFSLYQNINGLTEAQNNYTASNELAREVRANSNNLTLNVRLYALTNGQKNYKDAYNAILDIRSGKIARPDGYNSTFWAVIPENVSSVLTPAGETIKLDDLLKRQHFTDEEFALLKKANDLSGDLAKLETVAMDAIDGNMTPDVEKNLQDGETPQQMAVRILFSKAYNDQAQKIMAPINEFQTKLDARLTGAVNDRLSTVKMLCVVQTILLILLVLCLIFIFKYVMTDICAPVSTMTHAISKDASGKIRIRDFTITANNDLKELGDNLLGLINQVKNFLKTTGQSTEKIDTSITQLSQGMDTTATASQDVAGNVTESAQSAESQNASLAEVMGNMTQMLDAMENLKKEVDGIVAASKSAADEATQGVGTAKTAVETISTLKDTVANAAKIMDGLGQRSQEIGAITESISNIADQTSLLSINAAIEAASAGEHGRGFSVVAEEVRKLSEESQKAANNITEIISTIQEETLSAAEQVRKGNDDVIQSSDIINETGAAFERIQQATANINGMVAEAKENVNALVAKGGVVHKESTNIQEFSKGISSNMTNLAASSEEQSATLEEMTASTRELANLAEELDAAIKKFSVD